MNYDQQASFLRRQRWWILPAAGGCLLFLMLAARQPQSATVKVFAALLSLALAWAAYYLPNYLGMDADPWRRLFWLSRARWFALLFLAIVALLAGAKLVLIAVAVAALLHLSLLRILLKLERQDLARPIRARIIVLAAVYGASDLALIWLALRGGASPLLLSELLLCFAFFLAVFLRPRAVAPSLLFGLLTAAVAYLVSAAAAADTDRVAIACAVFLWATGATYLLARANRQNLSNYNDLLENLQTFTGETRESILSILLESVPTLAANWRRAQPQGQEAVAAWYSNNARLYLLANCQHHLLYRHIMYTLGLLREARGRVLDFGGGNGDFSRALARRGFDTTYLDVPGDAARYVKWRAEREGLPLKVVLDWNAPEGPFDVIFCLDVVEHLVDLPAVFERFHRLLRPGGKLLATYYNGPTSSAPMHIDPGYDAKDYLIRHGFRDIKSKVVNLLSPELMHKACLMILEREGS
jgi:2-polyprenyl-3-methyl-5-hydroxy-6-metoxy-1,4-benzoquinol methylase